MNKYLKGTGVYVILILLLAAVALLTTNQKGPMDQNYGMVEFSKDVSDNKVVRVEVVKSDKVPTGKAVVYFKDPERTKQIFPISDTGEFGESLTAQGIKNYETEVEKQSFLLSLIPTGIMLVAMIFLFMFIMNQAQGGASRMMSFGKSRAKMSKDEDKKITFDNVAGLEEEKEDLSEVVEFLKNPKKFISVGARIPRGFLLVGPPGTGKTLLAKAVAGEAKVPFFSISGSDFVEMYVGVGASRVRDLFNEAKKNSPCIVFIDEIDAVGRKRGAGLGGGHDEREQTLNQLLVEMDGFGANEGVIIIAATNRADILDPALLRPGRFDRHISVGRPDVKEREEILKVHAKGKPLSDDVDLQEIARTTAGFTGADLESLINEAAIYSAREDLKVIKQDHMRRAFVKVGIGAEKRSRVISDKEKWVTAYHESGHAIIMQVTKEIDSVHSISIIPTGFAGGYTMPLPKKDEMYVTKTKMEKEIVGLLGGRAAEDLILDDITTGASNDIERATKIARNMVVRYGMSDVIGPIQLGEDSDEVFIGRDWGHTRNYGENIAGMIDSEVKRIVGDAYDEALAILEEYKDVLHKTADVLMEKEKITSEEFKALFGDRLPEEEEDEVITTLREHTEVYRQNKQKQEKTSEQDKVIGDETESVETASADKQTISEDNEKS